MGMAHWEEVYLYLEIKICHNIVLYLGTDISYLLKNFQLHKYSTKANGIFIKFFVFSGCVVHLNVEYVW